MYLLDLKSGNTQRVSNGVGRTTCGWIHPSGKKVLFASSHADPDAKAKQAEEFKLRDSGKQRRYSWNYDEHWNESP